MYSVVGCEKKALTVVVLRVAVVDSFYLRNHPILFSHPTNSVPTQAVRDIMAARIALAAAKGCDGVEPDNVQVSASAQPNRTVTGRRFKTRRTLSLYCIYNI